MPAVRLGATLAALLLVAAPSIGTADPIANRDRRLYEEGAPALFVDVRTAGERTQRGRLARALWVSLGAQRDVSPPDAARLAEEVLRAVHGDRNRSIALVCEQSVKAASAAAALRALGFRQVRVVAGGLWAGEPWLAFHFE